MVIHLSKSETGHISLNEIMKIQKLLYRINNNQHFAVKYFAADGESGFNGFHKTAFNKYSNCIEKVLNGQITIEEFIGNAYSLCYIIPAIVMLHAAKIWQKSLNEIRIETW